MYETVDDCDSLRSARAKIRFADPFTDCNGREYSTDRVYEFDITNMTLDADGDENWFNPDCIDEVAEYIEMWLWNRFHRGFDMRFSNIDDNLEFVTEGEIAELTANGSVIDLGGGTADHTSNGLIMGERGDFVRFCLLNTSEVIDGLN